MRYALPWTLVVLLLPAGALSAQTPAEDQAADEKLLKEAGQAADAPGLLAFFRKRTFEPDDQKRAAALTRQLGDDQYEVRENATQGLIRLGPLARPYLREALASEDAEVRRRAKEGLESIDGGPEPALVGAAARLLAARSQDGAAAVVMNYLEWTPNDEVEEEVALAFLKIVEREKKLDPVVLAALTDRCAARRGAAALAVGRSGTDEQRKTVRKLLADPVTLVQPRAAQGLLAGRDRTALPALIELLAKAECAATADDLLGRVAGDKGPKTMPGDTAATRLACREAWETWWKANGDKVDLAKAEVDPLLCEGPRRATDVGTRWLDAVLKGDTAAVRRLSTYPLYLNESAEQYDADQFDTLVQGVKAEQLTFTFRKTLPWKTVRQLSSRQTLKQLENIPVRELYAVCVVLDKRRVRST